MPAFLVVLAIGVGLGAPHPAHAGLFSSLIKFFGGGSDVVEEHFPAIIPETRATADASALEADTPPGGDAERADAPAAIVQKDALLAPLNPVGTVAPDVRTSGQIVVYTVRSGDTLSSIAKSFGVSANTIVWANSLDSRNVRPGTEIIILPVSGVRHEVKKGDTIATIAKKYRASTDDIRAYNGLAPDEESALGTTLIVPNGELPQAAPIGPETPRASYFANLPFFDGYYIRPIIGGRRSRGIHGFNGIDLASSCGLPVLASADGTVIIVRESGWNGGYGRYVVISHPNGTQTLYGHLREIDANPGASVRQGETIGLIGSTGNSTGCHVHFEIRGARNPF